jgi:2-(1,2-epoxy-1,2-dihydrophenyl)acetyl-CoA isomerase
MTHPLLHTTLRDGVLSLEFNRPEKLNAINLELADALLAALLAAETDDAVRAILLTGRGRAFCAGRDTNEPPTEADLERVQAVSQTLVQGSKPVVVAVQGWALGAGLEWMLNADVCIAEDNARFKLPEASLGVFVTGGITALLPAIAGLARAKALMLLGDEFSAEQAHTWGLVWKVVPADKLLDAASAAAQRLARLQPEVSRGFKKVLNTVGVAQFEQAIALETAMQRVLMQHDNTNK